MSFTAAFTAGDEFSKLFGAQRVRIAPLDPPGEVVEFELEIGGE